jgi:superfamily I DNA/RNA helicase
LNVAGRTRKLRYSYRTTKAILETASAMLTILLGSRDDEDYLEPIYDGMEQGVKPVLLYSDTPQDALDRLVRELTALIEQKRIPLGAFLVIHGENVNRAALYAQLCNRLGRDRVWRLNERSQKKEPPGGHGGEHLRMAYVDTATGLEASIVFLIGMEPQFLLEALRADAGEAQRESLEENARKLYMAMTRAGQRLFVVSSQRIPAAMEALFDAP